jgi:hypothetical protein
MNIDKNHGGTLKEEREGPLYVIGDCFSHDDEAKPRQLELCGTVCELLGLSGHDKPVATQLLV